MNVEKVYHDYLVYLENKRDKTEKLFHASAAGSCLRKQYYSYYDFPQDDKDSKSYRILRLGTIVHEDIEDALELYVGNNKSTEINDIYVEDDISIPEFNLVGRYDIGELIKKEKNLFKLYDIKTAAAYKWTTMFGRKENRKPMSAVNYKMQLGTYALGIKKKYNVDRIEMYLLWYNKNTSQMREQLVSPEWIDKALEYWITVNEILEEVGIGFEEDLVPGVWEGVPYQDWECRYCQYYSICPSDLADKRR